MDEVSAVRFFQFNSFAPAVSMGPPLTRQPLCPRAGVTGSELDVALQQLFHTWAPHLLDTCSFKSLCSHLPVSVRHVLGDRFHTYVLAGG